MPRYLIERTFQGQIDLPGSNGLRQNHRSFFDNNAEDGVAWVLSYIVAEQNKTYCIYDAPNPQALRRAAQRNGIPVDRIIEVSVLDPYAYTPNHKESK